MLAPDSTENPPLSLKALFKQYRKLPDKDLDDDPRILQTAALASYPGATVRDMISMPTITQACQTLSVQASKIEHDLQPAYSYSLDIIPGLSIIPGLLPEAAQIQVLDTLMHSCLSDPRNKTNVHCHYIIPYPTIPSFSFFHTSPSSPSPIFEPLDPYLHHPFTTRQFLNSKLRWLTLGLQYDWTAKRYPPSSPPFPPVLKNFLAPLFPDLTPEAAIMNLYSPGDTLGVHRDIAEESGCELVSLSLGCEALFLVGLEGKGEVVVRLRSGDAVVLGGEARWAWHAVPKVIAGTCPEGLSTWPASTGKGDFEGWRGWMRARRLNLSVRQVEN